MENTLTKGDIAPDFTATLTDGSEVILSDMLKDSGVILYFYPRDDTPGCTIQACDFRDNFNSLKQSGWRVIGVSKDSAKSHTKFIDKHELPFELIVDSETELHQLYGTWTEKKLYGRTFLGCIRSTFAINQDGTLAWVGYKVQSKGHVERVMNDLNSQFQVNDQALEEGGFSHIVQTQCLNEVTPSSESGDGVSVDNEELSGKRHDLGNGSVAWGPCHVGNGVVIGADCSVGALAHVGSDAILGDRVRVQGGAYIASICELGDDVFIGPNATLLNDRHPPSQDRRKWLPVIVNDGVVIGGGATLLPGITIGEKAVIAAGSVATKDVPAGQVWAGNPARFMMSRDEYEASRMIIEGDDN